MGIDNCSGAALKAGRQRLTTIFSLNLSLFELLQQCWIWFDIQLIF